MTANAPFADVLDVLTARLRGTSPQHARAGWRLGAALATTVVADLDALLPAEPVPAAVLVGLVDHPGDPALLLTVRASRMRRHAGQISFPGGRLEGSDESPQSAAVREAHEEIGLDSADIQVIGFLPDHLVLTGYRVTPVVARVTPGIALHAEATEVEQVFELPWSTLDDDSNIHAGERTLGGVSFPVREIHHGEHRIWGLTAAILLLLRDIARGARA